MQKGPAPAGGPGPSLFDKAHTTPERGPERGGGGEGVGVGGGGGGAPPTPRAALLDHAPQARDGVGKDERDAHGDHNEGQQSHVGFPLSVVVIPVMAEILPRLRSCHEWQGCHLPSIYCQLCATMGG